MATTQGFPPESDHPALESPVDEHDVSGRLDRVVFGVSAALALKFVAWGFVDTGSLGSVSSSALDWTVTTMGWLFVLTASAFVVFVIWLAMGRFGDIPLGNDKELPEFSTVSWIAMMFSAGMGIGLMFYGVSEPLAHFVTPPPGTGGEANPEAVQTAMATTLFHWTLHPWAIYAVVGIAIAYGVYRKGRPQLISSAFSSLIGKRRAAGPAGRVIDILAIFATLFGSAASLGLVPTAVGSYFQDLAAMSARTDAAGGDGMAEWLSGWTVFYWAWWLSWTPFVGMFIARISRGRTIRQFVTGVLLVPSLVSLVWFAIFGGAAIQMQQNGTDLGAEGSPEGQLFGMLDQLPLATITSITVMLLVAIFFVSGADAASLVMGMLSERGTLEPSRWTVVFWGVATGGVAAVMLLVGGDSALTGLQNITIVVALPFVVVMIGLCFALVKDLRADPLMVRREYGAAAVEQAVVEGVTRHGDEFTISVQKADEQVS